ncbi:enoyl-CoA hydratase domain-containing protein 2, mitochondrial [Pararge aegeria]|uniref:enoyl-CoA hydratase domain-containing protein 2, mitochondrial n=1 Tax=Pararge aegeria TaxID=116150 RepID=UPI0019D27D85|nr:enoyl-CoA hydratase domain-containing protein 2, mitochondrial [Pararge aegeria]XP_039753787.1 enoyl-CoA hydratase domain-containing protein 2, mitochondrial [Pararge aegeria]
MIITRISSFKQIRELSLRCVSTINQKAENVGPVVFQKLSGDDRGIAVYGLNSPNNKNALGFDLLQSMKEVNKLIREDTKISVVILHSLVKGIFCAGANLKERFKMNDDEVATFVRTLRNTFIEIEDLPMPTIAAVEGVAVGGGLELALACDIRIAAETAKLGLVETGRGLIPGAGGTQRLPRVIHPNIAKELIFTSRIVTGKEAKDLGVVNHVVPQNSTNNAAYERAISIAREIISNAPIALRCAKQAINEGVQLSIKDGYEVEQKCYELNIPTQDRREGMLSFIEKRKPQYKGH